MTFRLLNDTGYNRILDWSHGTSDNGIYDNDRYANYFRPWQSTHQQRRGVRIQHLLHPWRSPPGTRWALGCS